MNLQAIRLEEVAADKPYSIVGGPFGSKLTAADYVEKGVPVIRGTNLKEGLNKSSEM
jgi:type I restriction enzyme S subunit